MPAWSVLVREPGCVPQRKPYPVTAEAPPEVMSPFRTAELGDRAGRLRLHDRNKDSLACRATALGTLGPTGVVPPLSGR